MPKQKSELDVLRSIAKQLDNKQYVKAVTDLNPLIRSTSSSSHAESVKQLTSAGRTRYVRPGTQGKEIK